MFEKSILGEGKGVNRMDRWQLDIGEVCEQKQGREGNIKGRAGGGGFVKSVKGIIGKLRPIGRVAFHSFSYFSFFTSASASFSFLYVL